MQVVRSNLDNQELLISAIENISYKLDNLGNTKNANVVNITKSEIGANEINKYKDENIKVEDKIRR